MGEISRRVTAEIRSFLNWLLEPLRPEKRSPQRPAVPRAVTGRGMPEARRPPVRPARPADTWAQASAYLAKVRAKTRKLAEDFNAGSINRAQFQNLYGHYQREIRSISGLIDESPSAEGWRQAVTEGRSVFIRRQHLARALGYAIYDNESGIPLSTLGEFRIDPALLVPMLSAYRAATKEMFGAGLRATQTEGGRWVCFVPGQFTTMLAVFTTEPAGKQLGFLDELHLLFERANRRFLADPPIDPSALLYPHEYYLGRWRR